MKRTLNFKIKIQHFILRGTLNLNIILYSPNSVYGNSI